MAGAEEEKVRRLNLHCCGCMSGHPGATMRGPGKHFDPRFPGFKQALVPNTQYRILKVSLHCSEA